MPSFNRGILWIFAVGLTLISCSGEESKSQSTGVPPSEPSLEKSTGILPSTEKEDHQKNLSDQPITEESASSVLIPSPQKKSSAPPVDLGVTKDEFLKRTSQTKKLFDDSISQSMVKSTLLTEDEQSRFVLKSKEDKYAPQLKAKTPGLDLMTADAVNFNVLPGKNWVTLRKKYRPGTTTPISNCYQETATPDFSKWKAAKAESDKLRAKLGEKEWKAQTHSKDLPEGAFDEKKAALLMAQVKAKQAEEGIYCPWFGDIYELEGEQVKWIGNTVLIVHKNKISGKLTVNGEHFKLASQGDKAQWIQKQDPPQDFKDEVVQ